MLVFDVETAALDEFQVPSAYLKRKQEKGEDWRDGAALHAMSAQVVSAAFYSPAEKYGRVYVVVPRGSLGEKALSVQGATFDLVSVRREADLLARAWQDIYGAARVVSFNGRSFDVPMLMQRSMIHGVKVTADLTLPKWKSSRHVDLFEVLASGKWGGGYGLASWCDALDVPTPKGDLSGKDVGAAWLAEEYERIAAYNAADTVATAGLLDVALKCLPPSMLW